MTNNTTMAGMIYARSKGLHQRYSRKKLTLQRKESFIKKVFYIICECVLCLCIVAAVFSFIYGEPPDNYTSYIHIFSHKG